MLRHNNKEEVSLYSTSSLDAEYLDQRMFGMPPLEDLPRGHESLSQKIPVTRAAAVVSLSRRRSRQSWNQLELAGLGVKAVGVVGVVGLVGVVEEVVGQGVEKGERQLGFGVFRGPDCWGIIYEMSAFMPHL